MKKIVWEAWEDPYHGNADSFGKSSILNQKPSIMEFLSTQEEDDNTIFGIEPKPTIATPYGLLSITEDTLASKRFDFWLLHTNFDITIDFVKNLEKITGIETIEVFTRYRLRIGFPKTPFFNTTETKAKVQKFIDELNINAINPLINNIQTIYGATKALEIQNIYSNIYNSPYWNIYLYPNAHVDIIISDKYEEFAEKIFLIKKIHQMVGGININSEEL